MFPRAEIKEYAKVKFKEHYGAMLGVYVIYLVIILAVQSITFGLGSLLIIPPLEVGVSFFCYMVYQGNKPDVGEMFSYGFNDYGRKLGGVLWSTLFTILWSLLFLIPGIIKGIAYSMTPYLLVEYPGIKATDAIKVSMKITDGRKWDIFVMYLSFIGWALLGAITLSLSIIFYSGPYQITAYAGMYDVLKKDALETGRITLADLGIDPNQSNGPQGPGPQYNQSNQGGQYQNNQSNQGEQYNQNSQHNQQNQDGQFNQNGQPEQQNKSDQNNNNEPKQ